MLAEQWEEIEDETKDLMTYTWEFRDNLHTVWEEAHNSLRESQEKQKRWYDAKSVLRTVNVGDKALILLPSCENKLLAHWQGPYEILEQFNPTTYRLALPHGQGREQIYNINLFKKLYEPTNTHSVRYITNVATD
ncbi:hypothetical protein NDU88_000753 [Pleurodeles waltl]|uniref:Tf2-1-like SH3-like domain-containing protein n=1 Tax=Pleurodeles waltl TaxID=8319 RepID=A0AAV7S5G4_PLEWA|nr:hypothetical protein NDU88_000753 [Pleurodeles waltl]